MTILTQLTSDEIKTIKSSYKQIEFENSDETEKQNIEKIYRISNKSSIDWASLFVYCYEQLSSINHNKIMQMLSEINPIYIKINKNLEEYNRDVNYGRHIFYNKLKDIIHDNMGEVKEIINFSFTKILYEADLSETSASDY